jgi:HEAT repeat protein
LVQENEMDDSLNEEIRIRASEIIALGKSRDKESIRLLIDIMENKKEVEWLRGCAAIALGRISGEEVTAPLIAILGDESPLVTRTAILALCDVGSKQAVPALEAIMDNPLKKDLHPLTVNVLKEINGNEAVPILLKALDSPDTQVKRNAALALGDLRSKAAVLTFIRLMGESDECLRAIAASSLGLIGDNQGVEILIKALNDREETVRAIAASSLGYLGEKKALGPLEKASQDKNETVRKQAAAALAKIKSQK